MLEDFKVVGLNENNVQSRLPAMYSAFCYGAPPYAGNALGIERMIMFLIEVNMIREVIPFPMNKKGQDVMMDAPSHVNKEKLNDVRINIYANDY